ncbi:MAG: helix-turn-helix transcriptional regulator [Clostridia bacterium]|nr:helix-turn-helix transcriptional regulator [Clostridia bacterium]
MSNGFKKIIKSDRISVKYAKGASDVVGREFHPYNEIIYFIGEEADFVSDNLHLKLKPKTLLVIPKQCYHQLNVTRDVEKYHRLVIHFDSESELDKLFAGSFEKTFICEINEQISPILERLINTAREFENDKTAETLAFAAGALLVYEIRRAKRLDGDFSGRSDTVQRCIEWIEANIHERITLELMSADLNISESGISHAFRREMNISLYKYVLKKRLALANEKILDGKSPTEAALECGFCDYSGFFKQYKKTFGKPPSVVKRSRSK